MYRALKDIEDLVQLTKLSQLDLNERRSAGFCSSPAAWNFMNSSNENATPSVLNDAADLEFPDWSGGRAQQRHRFWA